MYVIRLAFALFVFVVVVGYFERAAAAAAAAAVDITKGISKDPGGFLSRPRMPCARRILHRSFNDVQCVLVRSVEGKKKERKKNTLRRMRRNFSQLEHLGPTCRGGSD